MVYGRNELVFMDVNVFSWFIKFINQQTLIGGLGHEFGDLPIDSMLIFHSYNWYNN